MLPCLSKVNETESTFLKDKKQYKRLINITKKGLISNNVLTSLSTQFYAGTLHMLNTNDTLSLINYWGSLSLFLNFFSLQISSSLLYLTFKGHNNSSSRRIPLDPLHQMYSVTQFKFYNLPHYFFHSIFTYLLY